MDAADLGAAPRRDTAPAPLTNDAGAGAGAHVRVRRSSSRQRLVSWLVVWDGVVAMALLLLAARFSGAFEPALNAGAANHTGALAVLLAVTGPAVLAMAGAYHQRRRRGGSRLMYALRLVVVAMVVTWVAIMVGAAAGWPVDLARMFAVAVALPPAWLLGRWACDRHPATRPERVLLVGSGMVAGRVVDLTARHRERRLEIVGRVESSPSGGDATDAPPLLGDLAVIPEIVQAHGIERIIVAFGPESDAALLDVLRECVSAGVQVDVVPRLFDLVGPAPRAHTLGSLALLEVPGLGLSRPQRAMKRGADIAGALLLIALFAPVMAIVALAICVVDGWPIFFRQVRVGERGRSFSIVKYRSMSVDCDAGEGVAGRAAAADRAGSAPDAGAIADMVRELKGSGEARVTRLGAVLRKTSIDELPQLFNVLRGDMSLVGPRPLRPFEAAALTPWQLARQELRPGVTGLWQVLGRSAVGWDERMQLDYAYVAHWSFATDLQILARTLPAVVRRDGAV